MLGLDMRNLRGICYRHGREVALSSIVRAVLLGNIVLYTMVVAWSRRWFRGAALRDIDDESVFNRLPAREVLIESPSYGFLGA
jgi:hypothetical protein